METMGRLIMTMVMSTQEWLSLSASPPPPLSLNTTHCPLVQVQPRDQPLAREWLTQYSTRTSTNQPTSQHRHCLSSTLVSKTHQANPMVSLLQLVHLKPIPDMDLQHRLTPDMDLLPRHPTTTMQLLQLTAMMSMEHLWLTHNLTTMLQLPPATTNQAANLQ